MKSCGACKHYSPLKGEPAAGYCEFVEHPTLPFWMDINVETMTKLRRLPGNDLLPTDGAECDAFSQDSALMR